MGFDVVPEVSGPHCDTRAFATATPPPASGNILSLEWVWEWLGLFAAHSAAAGARQFIDAETCLADETKFSGKMSARSVMACSLNVIDSQEAAKPNPRLNQKSGPPDLQFP